MHCEVVVDLLQTHLNNTGLTMFVASVKVGYRRNRQK